MNRLDRMQMIRCALMAAVAIAFIMLPVGAFWLILRSFP